MIFNGPMLFIIILLNSDQTSQITCFSKPNLNKQKTCVRTKETEINITSPKESKVVLTQENQIKMFLWQEHKFEANENAVARPWPKTPKSRETKIKKKKKTKNKE